MSTKFSLIPVTIQFHGGIVRHIKIPAKMTVKNLMDQLKDLHYNITKGKQKEFFPVGLVTKVGDLNADYWLSDPKRTLEPFRKNVCLEVLYKSTEIKHYRTEIRNYVKISKEGFKNGTIVRNNHDSKIYMLRQFSK